MSKNGADGAFIQIFFFFFLLLMHTHLHYNTRSLEVSKKLVLETGVPNRIITLSTSLVHLLHSLHRFAYAAAAPIE